MTTTYCPQCGQPIPATSRFCPGCGAPRPAALPTNCPTCGAAIAPGAQFCASCGSPIAAAPPVSQPTSPAYQPLPGPPGTPMAYPQAPARTASSPPLVPLLVGAAVIGGGLLAAIFFIGPRLLGGGPSTSASPPAAPAAPAPAPAAPAGGPSPAAPAPAAAPPSLPPAPFAPPRQTINSATLNASLSYPASWFAREGPSGTGGDPTLLVVEKREDLRLLEQGRENDPPSGPVAGLFQFTEDADTSATQQDAINMAQDMAPKGTPVQQSSLGGRPAAYFYTEALSSSVPLVAEVWLVLGPRPGTVFLVLAAAPDKATYERSRNDLRSIVQSVAFR